MSTNKSKAGYTLIEILVVLAITVIILSVVINSLTNLVKNQALDRDYASIVSLLDQAKSFSVNSKSASQYGVFFASSTITLFKGQEYIPTNFDNQVYTLNSRVIISSVDLVGSSTDRVIFDRITGYANASGTVSVSFKDGSGLPRIIQIYRTGVVEI